jgi:hypothetical protein
MTDVARAILWGGSLCGVLGAVAATTAFRLQGVPGMRVWQTVASGLLGESAFRQGAKSAAVGLLLHFFIAFTAAGAFCLAALHAAVLLQYPIASGALYGIAVFLVMNLIVRPLSRQPKRPATRTGVLIQLIIHMVIVGQSISRSAAHFLNSPGFDVKARGEVRGT